MKRRICVNPRSIFVNTVAWLCLSFALAPAVHAQPVGADKLNLPGGSIDPLDRRVQSPVAAPVQVAGGPDYRVGPGDQLWISVLQAPELATTIRVSQQGVIALPLIGTVKAGGLTTLELKQVIEEEFARKYVKDPDVTVQVTDAVSHSVSVVGAVQRPGPVRVPASSTLLEVISLAGGLAPNAGDGIVVLHKSADGTPEARELKINAVMGAQDPNLNVLIYPGDVVKVPVADVVYVVGAVNKPGAYPMQGNERLTVIRAIALGQGLATASAQNRALVVRVGQRGERVEIPVDLKAVLKGKAEDVPLQAHDVLFVPISGGKVAGRAALDAFLSIFAWRPGF